MNTKINDIITRKTKPTKDLVGMKFGLLTITECLIPSKGDINKRGLWRAACDCGGTIDVQGTCLRRRGVSKGAESCGCLRSLSMQKACYGKRKPDRIITIQYHAHKNQALRRNLKPLSREDWESIVFKPCHYCGEIDKRESSAPIDTKKYWTEEDLLVYKKTMNGVDRVDSNKGYELDNCVPCCGQCNFMKLDYPQEDFFYKVELIYNKRAYSNATLEQYLCN